jgi:hypothetical protein
VSGGKKRAPRLRPLAETREDAVDAILYAAEQATQVALDEIGAGTS